MKKALLAALLCSLSTFAFAQVAPSAPANLSVEGGSPYTPPASGGSRTVGDEWFVEDTTRPPLFGWTGRNRSSGSNANDVVYSNFGNGGPRNRPYVRQTIRSSLAEFGDELYFERLPATADKVYVRFSWRQNTENQLQKLLIVNPGGTNRGRTILQNYGWSGGMAMRVAIDGGLQCQTDGAPVGEWQDYQLEISYRGSWTGYKLWRNSNDYNNPTCQWQGAVTPLTTSNWVTFSGYHQGNVASSGTRIVDHADVRIGPTFDRNWH